MDRIDIDINGRSFEAELADNEASRAFSMLLPLQLDMQELNGNEKYCRLSSPLPSDPTSFATIEAGDVMLFQNDNIVIFYETHPTSYKYTRIGKIHDVKGLTDALGKGSVQVDFREWDQRMIG